MCVGNVDIGYECSNMCVGYVDMGYECNNIWDMRMGYA